MIKNLLQTGSVTFKPLSRGRFRCNQTGVITKHPKEYRWQQYKLYEHQQRQLKNKEQNIVSSKSSP